MKLKKIASLMLAGIMAVSMLAGCKTGDSSSSSSSEVVPTGMVAAVIDNLDSKTTDKVAFTASTSLENALESLISYAGMNASDTSKVTVANLKKFDTTLSTAETFGTLNNKSDEETSITGMVKLSNNDIGASDAYIANQLADLIDAEKVYESTSTWNALPEFSGDFKDKDGNTCYYDFDYAGEIAVVGVTDAQTGRTTYVVAYTVTMTPTKVEK